jgi:hypothetical protein
MNSEERALCYYDGCSRLAGYSCENCHKPYCSQHGVTTPAGNHWCKDCWGFKSKDAGDQQ